MLIMIGIKETHPGVWRVTYNGHTLGDSRGYSRAEAAMEARDAAAKPNPGHWEGSQWVNDVRQLESGL